MPVQFCWYRQVKISPRIPRDLRGIVGQNAVCKIAGLVAGGEDSDSQLLRGGFRLCGGVRSRFQLLRGLGRFRFFRGGGRFFLNGQSVWQGVFIGRLRLEFRRQRLHGQTAQQDRRRTQQRSQTGKTVLHQYPSFFSAAPKNGYIFPYPPYHTQEIFSIPFSQKRSRCFCSGPPSSPPDPPEKKTYFMLRS